MLKIKDLSKDYISKDKNITALKNLSLDIPNGRVVCFLGPNGAGKTTTIKLLGNFVKPTSGDIFYNDISIKNISEYLKNISVLFEGNRSVLWYLKPQENIRYLCGMRGIRYNDCKDRIEKYIDLFELRKYENLTSNKLSRGNQQKLALACVFVLDTDIVLLDEPTLGLDFEASEKLMEAIKEETIKKNKIFVMTSHDADFIDRVADIIIIIKKGEIIDITTVKGIKEKMSEESLKSAYLKLIKEN